MKHSRISSTRNLYIDIGSGYNPKPGYKTADITGFPNLDYVIKDGRIYSATGELEENSVDGFRLRNVIHHVKDLDRLFTNLFRYLNHTGEIEIIECSKEHYYSNFCLDNLWYRYVISRPEIWFSRKYRNYIEIAEKIGFRVISKKSVGEKEIIKLIK